MAVSEQWTLHREHVLKDIISELNDTIRTREAELAALHDVIESQQAELNAARQVIKQSRLVSQVKTQDDMYETVHAFPELAAAIDTYDAARAEQEAT